MTAGQPGQLTASINKTRKSVL